MSTFTQRTNGTNTTGSLIDEANISAVNDTLTTSIISPLFNGGKFNGDEVNVVYKYNKSNCY